MVDRYCHGCCARAPSRGLRPEHRALPGRAKSRERPTSPGSSPAPPGQAGGSDGGLQARERRRDAAGRGAAGARGGDAWLRATSRRRRPKEPITGEITLAPRRSRWPAPTSGVLFVIARPQGATGAAHRSRCCESRIPEFPLAFSIGPENVMIPTMQFAGVDLALRAARRRWQRDDAWGRATSRVVVDRRTRRPAATVSGSCSPSAAERSIPERRWLEGSPESRSDGAAADGADRRSKPQSWVTSGGGCDERASSMIEGLRCVPATITASPSTSTSSPWGTRRWVRAFGALAGADEQDLDADPLAQASSLRSERTDHVGRGEGLAELVAVAELDGLARAGGAEARLHAAGEIAAELLAVGSPRSRPSRARCRRASSLRSSAFTTATSCDVARR